MKRWILILLLLSSFCANGQNIDIIKARNGDVYEGYITLQKPGKQVEILSNISTLTVSHHDIQIGKQYNCRLQDLTENAASYFGELSPECEVTLCSVTVRGMKGNKYTLKDCIILENGNDVVITSFFPYSFVLDWKDIKTAAKVPYRFDYDFGIVDRLILSDANSIEGQMIEQDITTGKMKFRDRDGNVTNYIKSTLYSINHDPINNSLSIWEQTPYCDKVIKKDGSEVKGFIISNRFGESVSVQLFNTDAVMDIPFNEIESYGKYPNPLFSTENGNKIILLINGKPTATQRLLSDGEYSYVMCPQDSISTIVSVGTHINIKYLAGTRTSRIQFVRAKSQKEFLYSRRGLRIRKTGMENWPYFNDSCKVEDFNVNYISNDGRYIVADMVFDTPGLFVMYVKDKNECICFNVID